VQYHKRHREQQYCSEVLLAVVIAMLTLAALVVATDSTCTRAMAASHIEQAIVKVMP
jgi:hypothetical protein